MKLPIKLALISFFAICSSVFLTQLLDLVDSNPFSIIKILALLILIVLPISILVWLILLQVIVKPLKTINKVTNIIAIGDLGKRVEVFGRDEFAELSTNINTMIHNMTRAFQNMANSLRSEKEKEKQLQLSFTQLEKEKAKAEALLSSMNEGVVAINRNGGIMLFNKAATGLTGMQPEEVIDKPYSWVLKFLNEKDETQKIDFIKSALLGQPASLKEHLVIIRKDGYKTAVLPSISVIRSADQQTQGVVVVLRDVSQMRQLEKTKDEFLSIASHELRTPMTAIKGLISMIFEGDYGKFSEELKDPLQDVALSVERLIQLVNDMLDVSRIEFGRFKFTLADLPVNKLCGEIVELVKPLAQQKGVSLEMEDATDQILTDPDKFKQILSNLVGNSIKFTDTGKIAISFKKEGERLFIYVTDTGLGISPQDQQKLFSKFAQISTTQTGRPKGTGLGLYISREYARKLGGDMWIERSEPDKGSTFAFSMPLSNSAIAQKVKISLKNFLI